MDALYKHHCERHWDEANTDKFVESIPSDDELNRMFLDAYCVGTPPAKKFAEVAKNFRPNARETMHKLMSDFDQFPGLSEIAPRHRWRLIVDRQ
jgi:hypothetical protein